MKFSEKQLDGIFFAMREALLVVNRKCAVTFMNQAAAVLLFIAPLTASGKDIDEVAVVEKASDEHFSMKGLVQRVLSNISIVRFGVKDLVYCRNKAGKVFSVALEITSILEGDEITGALITMRDITEEKNLNRAKSEFLSLASHQLRSPLTQASWYLELLISEEALRLTKTQREYLDRVYESAARMTMIVNDLLTLSRIELGLIAVRPAPASVERLAEAAAAKMQELIASRGIAFRSSFGKDIPALSLDPEVMASILSRVLSYALRSSPHGSEVSLRVSKREGEVLVTISDRGASIEVKEGDAAFPSAFQMTRVHDEEVHLTGLELHLARALVEQSGGMMWIARDDDKGGNVFYIAFPLTGMREKQGVAGVA